MWLLTSSTGHLGGKRLWLRPGTSHLLGRTSSKTTPEGERVRYVDHNTVSRKHLVVRVDPVAEGDSGKVFKRSGITVVEGSRSGSQINGEVVKKEEKRLNVSGQNGRVFEIVLGKAEDSPRFRLEWKEVVLTFTGVGKKAKKDGSALQEERAKLEDSDVKLVTDYLTQETSHLITKKRNTAQTLQALVQGRWTVTEHWVEKLAKAVKRRKEDELETSLLEDDFDANWPKEEEFVVPSGEEPTKRPSQYLKPDPARAEVFADYIFVFLSDTQYESLLPIITSGGGKAMLFEYELGKSKPEEVRDFARGLIGKKNNASYALSQEPGPGGVVVVRLTNSDAGPDMEEVSHAIGQRTINQNEFLDAVLMKDTSNFRTPLMDSSQDDQIRSSRPTLASSSIPRAPADSSARRTQHLEAIEVIPDSPPQSQRPPRSDQNAPQTQTDEQPREDPPAQQPSYKPRRVATTRPQGFDDFDPSQIVKAESDSDSSDDEAAPPQPSQAANAMEVDEPSQSVSGTQRNARKRPAPEERQRSADSEEVLPGQAALKRRKTEALRKGDKSFMEKSPEPKAPAKEDKNDKTKKGKSRVKTESEDIKKLRAKREEEDERRRLDEEALQHAGQAEIKRIDPQVETFELPVRPSRRQESEQPHDPAWNGRKNFKRFRSNKKKDGEAGAPRPRALESQRNYVSLEEIPGKGHGLGDEYWLETGHDRPRKKGRQVIEPENNSGSVVGSQHRQSGHAIALANGTQVLDDAEEESDMQAFRRRVIASREADREEELAQQAFEEVTSSASQTLRGDSQPAASRKRTGAQAKLDLVGAGPAAKKPRAAASAAAKKKAQTIVLSDDDDEEEDQMAFRRKRR